MISAHAGETHALHFGFVIFCLLVVLFCVVAAKVTAPKPSSRD